MLAQEESNSKLIIGAKRGEGAAVPGGVAAKSANPPQGLLGAGAKPLPCLYSHNSTEGGENEGHNGAQKSHNEEHVGAGRFDREAANFRKYNIDDKSKKGMFALGLNVRAFCDQVGINRVGFLTLTFPDNVHDYKEAQRRWNSLNTHFMIPRFGGRTVVVKERQKRGAWHYHALIDCGGDIRTGFDWEAFEQASAWWYSRRHGGGLSEDPEFKEKWEGQYVRSATPLLRSLWSEIRHGVKAFGFGRTELLPIRSTGEAVGKYVGKYLIKNCGEYGDVKWDDKKVRRVMYGRGWERVANSQMAWFGKRMGVYQDDGSIEWIGKEGVEKIQGRLAVQDGKSAKWRKNVARLAGALSLEGFGDGTPEGMRDRLGPRWAYRVRDVVIGMGEEEEDRRIIIANATRLVMSWKR